jgi:hypothetical protein
MLYKFSIYIGLILVLLGCKQPVKPAFYYEVELNEDTVYLAYRGTNSKQGVVARRYNNLDSPASHVGILLFSDATWKVYHVIPALEKGSAFIVSEINDYYSFQKENLFFASIWSINDLSINERGGLEDELSILETKQIFFDALFEENGPDQLYCSEMIVKVLEHVNPQKYLFKKTKKRLTTLHARYLGKDSINFYPVDIFQASPQFVLNKAWDFN